MREPPSMTASASARGAPERQQASSTIEAYRLAALLSRPAADAQVKKDDFSSRVTHFRRQTDGQNVVKMVYDWAQHEAACRRLYIDEKRPLEEVMQCVKRDYNFAPR
jgi:hypothetical protein